MRSWASPDLPPVPGTGREPSITDSSTGQLRPVDAPPLARLYICGITPYDATHIGHAATYVMFDLLHRALLDAGHEVIYCENVTDVDDPLLERAGRDGVDWRELAAGQTELFRTDIEALRVLPPQAYIGVTERIGAIGQAVARLLASGAAYRLPVTDGSAAGDGAADVYLDVTAQPTFGQVSNWSAAQMAEVFAERGGDPARPGKRDPLDPLLWRAARTGEPSWPAEGLGAGRPGWHIECTCIALEFLDPGFDVQAGGVDLIFPHHEMSAVQADALHGPGSFARLYLHQEMVGLDGEKMSKSRGNLVFVSALRARGADPMAIRLALLAHHYASPWDWTDATLAAARERLERWRARVPALPADAQLNLVARVRDRLADDLDAPGALAAVDEIVLRAAGQAGSGVQAGQAGPGPAAAALDSLLGIRL